MAFCGLLVIFTGIIRMARPTFDYQLTFFQTPIDELEFDLYSRDQMPKLLLGIQEVYKDQESMAKILKLIQKDLKAHLSELQKRIAGLSAWEVFVLICLRQNGNYDYDQIGDLATNHATLRAVMGLAPDSIKRYPKSTVHDNVKAVKTETVQKIIEIVVKVGLKVTNPDNKKLELVADTFVYETNIHYHVDYVSIMDGVRSLLRIGKKLSTILNLSGFRKSKYINQQVKALTRKIGQLNRSRKKDKDAVIKETLEKLIQHMNRVFEKCFVLLDESLDSTNEKVLQCRNEIIYFLTGTSHEAELAVRRIFKEEKIPPGEKVFSLFESHTELICKGKAKRPREYGHRVLVIQDQFGIVHTCERVESGYTDSEVIVDAIKKLKRKLPDLKSLSLDKGFWSPENKNELEELVDILVLPKKGEPEPYAEKPQEYKRLRRKHAKVESCINALEQGNNLHICYDKGLEGFDQSVARAGLARNLHEVGICIAKQKIAQLKKAS